MPSPHYEPDAQGPECAPVRRDSAIMIDNDMIKDVKAIRTILAKRNGLSSTVDGHVSTASTGVLHTDPSSNAHSDTVAQHIQKDTGVSGTRYHYKQPNEPESEQWINDGECRRSQGDRFARGHSARFTELHAPPTSRFSSARPSSGFISRPSSQGTFPRSTTCATPQDEE
jgi:hypothetical protein